MKPILFISLVMAFYSCDENTSNSGSPPKDISEKRYSPSTNNAVAGMEMLSDSVSMIPFKPNDTILADLNCDGYEDEVYFLDEKERRLCFEDGRDKKKSFFGIDIMKNGLGGNFTWVDTWGITRDTSTYEIIVEDDEITGSRTISLNCPSIVLRKEESGGGIITFKNKEFRWIHQSD